MTPLNFRPPLHLANPHLQTVRWTVLKRALPSPLPSADRRLFRTRDGELLVGFASASETPGSRSGAPLAVLVHGLEGSSESHYMLGTARKLLRAGWHVLRLNQRGCGAGEGLTSTVHHGGRSDDLFDVVEALASEGYARIALVGFSLGGSLVLKLLGERGNDVPRGLVCAAALSPLVNPLEVQRHLDRPRALPYRAFFLRLMMRRFRRRARLFPGSFPDPGRDRPWTVRAFDDRYTAPYCGFASAEDYYRRADALPLVGNIRVPTLLIHAEDDPVVPFACYRSARGVIDRTGAIQAEFPVRGGHLGFYAPGLGNGDGFWAEDRALAFLGARCPVGP